MPEPRVIVGYDTYILAENEEQARTFAADEGLEIVEDVGWMMEVGYNDDEYDSKEEFEAEEGLSSWWQGITPREGQQPSDRVLRAWIVSAG